MTKETAPEDPGRGRSITELAEVPVDRVKRIGEKRAEALAALGIESVADLLMYYPRRYVDRTRRSDVADVGVGDEAVIVAEVVSVRFRRTQRGRALVELEVDDPSGRLRVVFFNQAWRAKQLPAGTQAMFFGKLDTYRGKRQLTNPVVDLIGNRTGRIVPIYPTTEASGIAGWEFGEWVEEALRRANPIRDPVPVEFLKDHGLVGRAEALSGIHHPQTFDEKTAARRRLAFDELLRLQLEVVMRRHEVERDARGIRHDVTPGRGAPDLVGEFKRHLPFELTKAQDHARRAAPDEPAPPGRRRLREDRRGGLRPARGHPGRLPRGVHGAYRGSGRAAFLRSQVPGRVSGDAGPGPPRGEPAGGRGASHEPHRRP
jgi:ATP-dependent DNA helicase RecG